MSKLALMIPHAFVKGITSDKLMNLLLPGVKSGSPQ